MSQWDQQQVTLIVFVYTLRCLFYNKEKPKFTLPTLRSSKHHHSINLGGMETKQLKATESWKGIKLEPNGKTIEMTVFEYAAVCNDVLF